MTPLAEHVTSFASFLTVLLDIFSVGLLFILITPLRRIGWAKKIAAFCGENAILLSFLIALGSVGGSLFYSEIAHFEPCVLCWWQRVFLYPQTIILFIALLKKDARRRLDVIALSGIGALVAIYHTLIQFGLEPLAPCSSAGVSCQVVYFLEYNYVTIPTMSLTAFALILLFMLSPKSTIEA